jgi:hypothetical protein
MPPSVIWHFHPLRLYIFFFCYVSHTCPPVWGVILAKVISKKKKIPGSKGDCKGYIFSFVKGYQRWPFFIPNSCI